jgi:hypothetical protein
MKRIHARYTRIFLETNGPGPWDCYGCHKPVRELLVHHIDENPLNDDPANLAAMHEPCHVRLHHGGKPKSVEHRAKISEANRGRVLSAETRAKIGAKSRGRKHSAETRAKMSATRTGKKRKAVR